MRLLIFGFCAGALLAQSEAKPDLAEMPANVHAPLFRKPETERAGSRTERLLEKLPQGMKLARLPHRNFIDDEIFARMERDGVPHAPLTTDREFIRRVRDRKSVV